MFQKTPAALCHGLPNSGKTPFLRPKKAWRYGRYENSGEDYNFTYCHCHCFGFANFDRPETTSERMLFWETNPVLPQSVLPQTWKPCTLPDPAWMHGLHQFMVGFCNVRQSEKAAEPKSIDRFSFRTGDCEHAQSINYCVQIFLFSYPTEEDHSRGICQSWSPHQIGIWQERLVVWYGIFHIVSQKRLRRSCPLSLFLRHHWNLCLFRWTLLCCDVPCSFLFFLFFLCVLSKFVFRSSTATQQHSNAANIDLDCARRCGWWRRGERGDQTAQQQNGRRSLALQRIWRSSEVFEFEDAKSDRSRIISMCFLSIFVCSVFDFDLRRRRWL